MSRNLWEAFFNNTPIDQSWIEKAISEKPKFEATITGRLTDQNEAWKQALHDLQRAGFKASDAAKGISTAMGRLIKADFAEAERRVLNGFLNPANLYGPGEWRPIGKQRARKLRKRHKLVERTVFGWRWWRTLDPHKLTAAELFGIPYAQVQPHHRKSAKRDSFAMMYSPDRWTNELESRKPATPPPSAPRA